MHTTALASTVQVLLVATTTLSTTISSTKYRYLYLEATRTQVPSLLLPSGGSTGTS